MTPLPIDALLPEIRAKLQETGSLVLRAATGAGKTTRVPPALLADSPGIVLLVEPRRVAVRAAARRMADEDGTPLGGRFGFQVRFERVAGPNTRCLALTPGILLRMLQDDPFLETVGTILFDEFHERGLETDLALGLVNLLRRTVRPELRVIVMSATIDTAPLAVYLGDCPTATSDGRTFPVEIRYRPKRSETKLDDHVVAAVEEATLRDPGDVLIFLPGVREIRNVLERLAHRADRDGDLLLPLHGDLPPEEQDRALQKTTQRKIIASTNVAEASVTVDGVTIVIDSGLAQVQQFDPSVGMDRLELRPIARSSAEQRAGRAGRTQPGLCIRLWDELGHRARPEQLEPEIRRVDLASAVLTLAAVGETDFLNFPWLDAPKPESVTQALELLSFLGAWNDGSLTPLGKELARLPVHPRVGRLLLVGRDLGIAAEAAMAGALLGDRDPFNRDPHRRAVATDSDVGDRVFALLEFQETGRTEFACGSLHRGAARNVCRSAEQLQRILGRTNFRAADPETALRQAVFAAYADRLAKRRSLGDSRAVMLGGRGLRFAPSSGLTAELFVAVDVDAGGSESLVRSASAIARSELPAAWVTTSHELTFDEEQTRLVARKVSRYGDLILDETPSHLPSDREPEVTALLAESAQRRWSEVTPAADSAAGKFLTRWHCLKAWRPDLDLPSFDPAMLHDWLLDLCRGRKSFAELRAAPWLDRLHGLFNYDQRQRLDREAPEHIVVPTGSAIALTYEEGRPPILAVRIQELFGLAETPRIAGGRVPVLLHLLSPNYRPQQVTADLASFWINGYPLVRKDLRGRYPKHSWPDNPLEAEAIRGPKKRTI